MAAYSNYELQPLSYYNGYFFGCLLYYIQQQDYTYKYQDTPLTFSAPSMNQKEKYKKKIKQILIKKNYFLLLYLGKSFVSNKRTTKNIIINLIY